MAGKKITTFKVGRDAKTGRFLTVAAAKRRKSTAIVETIKRPTTAVRKGKPVKK